MALMLQYFQELQGGWRSFFPLPLSRPLWSPIFWLLTWRNSSHRSKRVWFSVNEKEPLGYVRVEVIEASDMKAAYLNGLSDPYVKGQLGLYRFKGKVWCAKQTKTEEYGVPMYLSQA